MRIIATTTVTLLVAAASVMGQVRPTSPGAGRSVTIAVVRDGPLPEDFSVRVENELRQVASSNTELVFLRPAEMDARWEAEQTLPALQAALDNPDVDYVLAIGAGISDAATEIPLTKPVVATFVQRPDFGRIHEQENNRSLTENLACMQIPTLVEADFANLHNIFPFPDTAYLLLPESYIDVSEAFADELRAIEASVGVRIALVPLGSDVAESVARLPADARAAFVTRTPQWSTDQRSQLFAALTERGVGSYGLVGHPDVEAGALAGRLPDLLELVARRAALNLNELIRGASTSELPVMLDVDPEMLVNARTVEALGYVPTYETLVTATILHPDALRREEQRLSFPEALTQADEGNPFLQVSQQAVQVSYHGWKRARSPLLPQAYAGIETFGINPRGLEGLIPDTVLNGGFNVRQMIYNDRSVTDYKSEGRLYEGSQQFLEADRLDVLTDAGSTFLNLVLSEILYRVDADNLQLTRDNLELAKVRLDAGYSGLDEVYRWESELNTRQSILFGSNASIETERVALNQILGLAQFSRWRPDEIAVDPDVFPFLDGGLSGYLIDPVKMERFREFLVGFALQSAPELLALQKSVEAQQLQRDQRGRRWWLPVFDTGFQWGYEIWRSPELPDLERDLWRWDITAAYPIFEGGFRAEDEKLNAAELDRLAKDIDNVRQLVERRTRTAIRAIEGSFPSIRYLNAAAEAARLNFEIVQDRYTEGLVNVTDLIDAQNDRFITERTARGAQYAFLLDLVALQRAISWFEDMMTPEERDALLAQARAFIDNPTPPPEEPGAGAFQLGLPEAPKLFGPDRALAGTESVFSRREP